VSNTKLRYNFLNYLPLVFCDGFINFLLIVTFVFSLLAVLVQLCRYINIHNSVSSSLLIIQHYIFRSNWPSSGV
jgi:hypothetical protein